MSETRESKWGATWSMAGCWLVYVGGQPNGLHDFTLPEDRKADAYLAGAAKDLQAACLFLSAWLEGEDAGPDYHGMTRDTHPEGEMIWREWWERQLRLCDLAQETARLALAKARGEQP